MTVFMVGDRVELSARGQGALPGLLPSTAGVVQEVKPSGATAKILIDGARSGVWFPVRWWRQETARV